MVDTPTQATPPEDDGGGNRIQIDIAQEMRDSYLAYAMSVIVGRALPDVRDGLKPVHRRALFAMHEQRNTWNASYKKSARIVGDVIGKYHPHGDLSVYNTIVRMAQDFSMRYLLVDGQGNFGSVDGDPAAAMRYTEVRMTRLAGDLLQDLEKETIDWQPNYDGQEREPSVLPAGFPNLLVNGSGGIAVGMATNMPPHNLGEAIRATVALIENPEITTAELMTIIPGPDFPTAGLIVGRQGIKKAYETGRGRVVMRALADFEYNDRGDEDAIIISELPYQVNKANLITHISDLVRDKRIDGIRDLRDESDRHGMRIVVELKRGAIGHIVLNQLYKMTAMQSTFGINNLAIVRGRPQVLGLKDILREFVHHRRDVVTRRCRFDLAKAEARAHLVEGFLRAIDIIDEIVQLIKASAGPQDAKEGLITRFDFTEVQAQAILDMRLARLTGLEREKLEAELAELRVLIDELRAILADDAKLMALIVEELEAIEAQHGDIRRTKIIEASGDITMEDLIADEDMVVTITTTGYVKRTPLSEYRTQHRGGKGRSGMNTKAKDDISQLFVASAHTQLMIFTDWGVTYPIKVWEVPVSGIAGSGKAIVNLVPLEDGEKIRAIVPVESLEDASKYLVFATRQGLIKRTALDQYKNIRTNGIRAINLNDDDDLIDVKVAVDGDYIAIATAEGMSIIFPISDARPMGRSTMGTRGIRLRPGDTVAALEVLNEDAFPLSEADDSDEEEEEIHTEEGDESEDDLTEIEAGESTFIFVTERGFGKRVPLAQFRIQRRGGLGLRALPPVPRNGPLVSMERASEDEDLMVVTDQGTIIRLPINQVRALSRQARGVRLIDAGDESVVASYAVSAADEEDEHEALASDAEGTTDHAEDSQEASPDDTPDASATDDGPLPSEDADPEEDES